jgi:eukaryotic-like serine/threonine-protein kinase
LNMVESVLSRLGVRLPASSNASLASLLWHRFMLYMRGTGFEERDASQIPPNDLMRADILGSLAAALGMIDTVRGADAQTRYLLLSLKLGDPVRVARALSLEAGYLATSGDANESGFLGTLERAEGLALRTRDPQSRGLSLGVRCTATFLRGAFAENQRIAVEAERMLSTECTDVDWEIGNIREFRAMSHFYLGELKQSVELVGDQIREAKERGDQYAYTNLRVALGYMPLLMAHEPVQAIGMLDEAIASWTHKSYHMQHFFHLLGVTQSELYGRMGKPYQRIMSAWPSLTRSFLLRVPMVVHTVRHLRGRAAVQQAQLDRTDRELLLRDAADCGAKLTESQRPYAAGWGFAVRAGVDAVRGHLERAVQRLEQAEAAFYEADMNLYAAATRYQLGRLLGGERGRELKVRAEEWFEAQAVRKPESFVDMLLPGFD